jgi:hypothetical protein
MHISENPKPAEQELGNRLAAQFKLAELMGVAADQIPDWCEKYAEVFSKIEQSDRELSERIKDGTVTEADLSFVRDQIKTYNADEVETDTSDEINIRAA